MPNNNKNRWPIKSEKLIEASAQAVWEQMVAPASVHVWHPFVKESYCDSWNGVGSIDHVTYYSGATFDREVINWIDGVGFDLSVSQNGANSSLVAWRIVALSENRCKMVVTAYLDQHDNSPLPVRWFMHQVKLKPAFKSYFELALRGFTHYAETGERIIRNQFGSHPIFSPGD